MLNIPESLRTILKQDYLPYQAPVTKQLVLSFADLDLTITDGDFTDGDSFSLEDNMCGDELTFGDCGSACLKFKVEEIEQNLVDKQFTAKFVIEGTDIKLGTFIVKEAPKSDDDTAKSIVAYDLMSKFDIDVVEWYESLTFPMSLKAFRNSLCTYCGVKYVDSNLPNDSMNVEKTISSNILNGREVLSKCEELNGCFGHMNRDGKLDHIVLSKSNPVETITDLSYDALKFEEYTTDVIDKVQIRTEDGDIGSYVGTGTNCYSITANYLVYGKTAASLQTICSNLSTNILGVTYRPYECDMQGLPYLNVGDYVKFEGNETANSYIMQRTLSGTQILADKASAKGSKTLSEDNNINVQIEQMKGKTNVLTRDVEKMESTITEFDRQISVLLPGPWYPDSTLLPCQNNMTNLEYEINSKILQTAKEITTEVNNVSEQLNSQISQTATSITAQVNNLSANMSAQFAITDAEISSKVEKNGIISSINQSAESITIKAEKLNLQGYATFSGLESGTTVINGGCITTGYISADRIKAGTLTGMTLSGGYVDCYSVTAKNMTSGTLDILSGGYIAVNGTRVSLNGHMHMSTEIYGVATSSDNISFSGSLNAASVTYCQATFVRKDSSDLRLKRNILDVTKIDNFYASLKPKSYEFKGDLDDGYTHYGLLAQEVLSNANSNNINVNGLVREYETRSYLDEGMFTGEKAYRIDYDSLHAFHIKMIQNLSSKVEKLEDKICKLESI